MVQVISYPATSVYQGHNPDYFIVEVNRKKGAIYKDGTTVVDPIYDQCYMYEDNFIRVKLNDLKGLISLSGELLLKPKYNAIEFVKRKGDTLIRTKINEQYQCFDTQMNPLSELANSKSYLPHRKFDWYEKDGLKHLVDQYGKPLNISAKNFHLGYVNSDSTVIITVQNPDGTINILVDGANYLGGNNEMKLSVVKALSLIHI